MTDDDNGRGRDAPKARGGPGIGITKTEGPPATVSVPYQAAAMIDDMFADEPVSLTDSFATPQPGDQHGRSTTEKGRRGLLAAIQRRWRGRFWAQSWWL